ncbi:MAG: polyprenyl synthetase family protein [Propioniciclava sp.]|uniref:polyprenyl synthetase family protein n=1 Tax=Propioniciclava sp. TaxID=2038686 RepID=UPI0039E52DBA
MLALTNLPALAGDAVDEAVESALRRLSERAERHGPGAARIVRAACEAARGGKRFRPRLVLASFQAFSDGAPFTSAVTDVAAGFELLHTAFVLHDDVIDRDVERRGLPNVSGLFRERAREAGADPDRAAQLGEAAAILAGDILLHEATRLIAGAEVLQGQRHRLLDLLDEAILVSATGELADVEHATLPDEAAADAVLAATRDKTALYSFSAPLRAGALLGGAPDDALEALAKTGRLLGLAFQLVDDLIGAFGTTQQAGREPGADLREGKQTALIAFARQDDSWPEVRAAVALAGNGPAAVRVAQAAVEATGARSVVRALIDDNLQAAQDPSTTAALPAAARDILDDIAVSIRKRIP